MTPQERTREMERELTKLEERRAELLADLENTNPGAGSMKMRDVVASRVLAGVASNPNEGIAGVTIVEVLLAYHIADQVLDVRRRTSFGASSSDAPPVTPSDG